MPKWCRSLQCGHELWCRWNLQGLLLLSGMFTTCKPVSKCKCPASLQLITHPPSTLLHFVSNSAARAVHGARQRLKVTRNPSPMRSHTLVSLRWRKRRGRWWKRLKYFKEQPSELALRDECPFGLSWCTSTRWHRKNSTDLPFLAFVVLFCVTSVHRVVRLQYMVLFLLPFLWTGLVIILENKDRAFLHKI
jgi:hypothetical protein